MAAEPRTLALVAFLLHAPGLRLLHGVRLSRPQLKMNLILVAFTLAALVIAWPQGWPARAGAYLAGHLAWSTLLAQMCLRRQVSAQKPELRATRG